MIWGVLTFIPPLFARRGLSGMTSLMAVLLLRGLVSLPFGIFYIGTCGLPTFIASLGWCGRRGSPIWHVGNVWPLIAAFLFFFHPATGMAPIYPLCWLTVPFFSFVTKKWQKSVLLDAWRASITAHTIGALLVLYFQSPEPFLWQSVQFLIPAERLIVALGMIAVVKVDDFLAQRFGYTVKE